MKIDPAAKSPLATKSDAPGAPAAREAWVEPDADLGLARPSDAPPPSLRELSRQRGARAVTTIRPLSEVLPFDRFATIVQQTVARVPDLAPLWSWQAGLDREDADRLYLLGGALRGMLIWVRDQILEHGPDGVDAIEVPTTEALLRQAADRDVLALGDLARPATEQVETLGDGWEVLAPLDHRNNVALGGPTIEKVGVGPRGIEDPFGGLEHFWRGELVFVYDGTQRSSVRHGYSVLAEALRFLRFAHELPGLTPTPDSIERLARVGPAEHGSLGRESQAKYLIEKPLAKFAHAVDDDPRVVLNLLRTHRLLACVADGPYQLPRALFDPTSDANAVKKMVARLVADGFDAAELRDARRILRLAPDEQVGFTEAALSMVAPPHDALVEVTPGIDSIAFTQKMADALEARDAGAWREAIDALRSPVHFYRAMFTRSELAASSNLEVTFGIAIARDGGLQERIQSDQERAAIAMLESLPTRDEGEKSEVAELLFRVIDDDEEIDAPWGADKIAYAVLAALDTQDPAVQMRCFEGVLADRSGSRELTDALLALSSPTPVLVDAVRAEVDAFVAGDSKKIGMNVTRLARALDVDAPLVAVTLERLEAELDTPAPDGRALGEHLRTLWHAESAPEPLLERVMKRFEGHLETTQLDDRYDAFAAGVSVFARSQGRDDLVQRTTDALAARWADTGPPTGHSYVFETWVRMIADAQQDATKEAARAALLGAVGGDVPERVANRWKHVGPESHPLPSDA